MFSGYLYHHDPPQPGYAIMTNFQNFQSGQDDAEAWQQFSLSATRPVAGVLDPAFIQRVGSWPAMTRDDEFALRELLETRKPAEAIIGKAVELVRQMADRPAANNTIGKQLSVLRIPRSPEQGVLDGYYSNVNSNAVYMHDSVILYPSNRRAMKDLQFRKIGGPNAQRPVVVSKVGRNHRCPCGSGKNKNCHGKGPYPPRFSPP
jgi:hypothetical protein